MALKKFGKEKGELNFFQELLAIVTLVSKCSIVRVVSIGVVVVE